MIMAQDAIASDYTKEIQNPDGSISIVPDMDKYEADKISTIQSTLSSNPQLDELTGMYSDYHDSKVLYESEKLEQDAQDKLFEDELRNAGIDLVAGQEIEVDGKIYNISPDDMIDFAMVRAYHGILFSRMWSANAREKFKMHEKAEERLKAKYPSNIYKGIVGRVKTKMADQTPNFNINKESEPLLFDLHKLERQMEDADFSSAIENRKQRILNRYGKDPNRTYAIFGEEPKYNEGIRRKLQEQASAYRGVDGKSVNLSETFEDFANFLNEESDNKKLDIVLRTATDETGEKSAFVHNSKGEGMFISWDQALELRKDLVDKYAPDRVKNIETIMNANNGSTSTGDPRSTATYRNGGGHFKNFNIDGMRGSKNLFVEINLVKKGSQIIPYLYFKQTLADGNEHDGVVRMPSVSNLGTALEMIKDPALINPASVALMIANKGLGATPEQPEEN